MRPLAVVLLLLGPLSVSAQVSTLHVGVQRPGGEPVVGATVQLGERGASTGPDGLAAFEGVAPGRYLVRVSFIGSTTEEVSVDLVAPGPWGLVVDLEDATNVLGGVVVEAEDLRATRLGRDGFFRRQRLGGGTILDAEDLAERGATLLHDALRGRVPGVLIQPGTTGSQAVSLRGRCRMKVYLDGTYSPAHTADLGLLPSREAAVVEVYQGLQVPVHYRGLMRPDEACGVILVWTWFSTTNSR